MFIEDGVLQVVVSLILKYISVTVQADNEDIRNTLESLSQEIATLSIASSINVSSDKPDGSVPSPVGADCIAWMKLKVSYLKELYLYM